MKLSNMSDLFLAQQWFFSSSLCCVFVVQAVMPLGGEKSKAGESRKELRYSRIKCTDQLESFLSL